VKKSSSLSKPKGPKESKKTISAKAAAHAAEFESFKTGATAANATNYSMKVTFKESQVVQHPKFGLGLVRSVQGDKIEVFFEDEVRYLVHGRT